MEATSSLLTEDRVAPIVTTTVARHYLVSVPLPPRANPRTDPKVEGLRLQVSAASFAAASAVERALNQLGAPADRVVVSRAGGIAFIFLGGAKYAMLESDEDGSLIALLSDRASTAEAETWVVEQNGLNAAVRRIRAFVGSPHGAYP